MIWYADDDIIIDFDKKPQVMMRYIYPEMSKDEIDAITDYPFINKRDINVSITDKRLDLSYVFKIEKNYTWDGATIPRLLWRLIGSKTQPEFLIASLVHDCVCEKHLLVNYDRKLSSKVFRALLFVAGVSKFKANIMYFFVDLYQRLFW